MKYRGREEILASILRSAEANNGTMKTKIMYDCFLSYEQLLYYLKYLNNNGLLTYDKSKNVYNMTTKGSEFLEICSKMSNLLKITKTTVTPAMKWK